MSIALHLFVAIASFIAMEATAYLVHRFIMHGPGWHWHRDHHQPSLGLLERNDRYALIFALPAAVLFIVWPGPEYTMWWVALGISAYGLLYMVFHDLVVHRRGWIGRWCRQHIPRSAYLDRLVNAHHLHHAVQGRQGAVSFGFLYAPPPERLRQELKHRANQRDEYRV